MNANKARNWDDDEHARSYLADRQELPRRSEGEAAIVDVLSDVAVGSRAGTSTRVLDLGTGDGRVLAAVLAAQPTWVGVALDHNQAMLTAAGERFGGEAAVELVDVGLAEPRRFPCRSRPGVFNKRGTS